MAKRDYSKASHTHILLPLKHSKAKILVCKLNGCLYREYWDGERYWPWLRDVVTHGNPPEPAIRPVSMWDDLN